MAQENAIRDANYVTSMLFKGSDGFTHPVEGDETTGRIYVDNAGGSVPSTITVANEATDTSCFVCFFTAATGDLGPKTNAGLTFNSNTGLFTSTILASSSLTASQILATDANKNLVSLAVATYPSLIELTYVKGVTSPIQTQLGTKITNPMTTGGDVIYGGASGVPTRLANGTAGQVLTSNGTTLAPSWQNAGSGANTALSNLASVAINTTLVSDTDNTDALGTTAIAWSDLFLGSGAVITFNSAPSTPDVTITHSSNLLTLDGGNLALGANNLTMTGSLAATGARVTKGWFTDVESTNMPTVGGTSLTTVAQTFQNKTITNSNNVLGGVTMTLGSDADGDIYYRSSNVLTRLAKGTADQVLTMNAGATAPEWADASGGSLPATFNWIPRTINAAGPIFTDDIDVQIGWNSTSITVAYRGAPAQVRAITADWADATDMFGAVKLGSYVYYLVKAAGATPDDWRVYRYDYTNLAGGGTQMSFSGVTLTSAATTPYMSCDGTNFYFAYDANNSANIYVLRKCTISGTTFTSSASITCGSADTGFDRYAVLASGNIYTFSSGDLRITKFNSSGTQQYQEPSGAINFSSISYLVNVENKLYLREATSEQGEPQTLSEIFYNDA